jgi:PAS domain-containing protein
MEMQAPSGGTMWIRSRGDVESADGKCAHIYASIQDIDLPKRLSIRLEESYREKSDLLEGIGDALFALDEHNHVTYWNHKAPALTGVSRGQILHRNLFEVCPFPIAQIVLEKKKR